MDFLKVQLSKTIPLPSLPSDAPGRPGSPRYRTQFGLLLRAIDEADQRRIYDDLVAAGYQPKVVST